ncbi:hypothetical protein NGRA_1027 [Nosema granulosis]|uniref:Uncharacterized protein n=1 Tax=Nosema granulosis TaxID=83296 RepID=A0A9P6H2G2_9MICR|nr:hypothetical protein NGRA_1027 [Nosema granulosis]
MKLNTSEFPLNKKVLYGSEDKIVYEEEKSGLSETWDKLSFKYQQDFENENNKQTMEAKSSKMLKDIKVELDTFMSTLSLVDKGIIKASEVKEKDKEIVNLKENMIDSSIKILDKGIEACNKACTILEDLNNVIFEGLADDRSLSIFGIPFKLVDSQLRMYFTEEDYAYINSENKLIFPDHWKPAGLLFTFEYEDNVFSTYYPPTVHQNDILNIKEYFKENNLCGKKNKHNISFEITRSTQPFEEEQSSYVSKRLAVLCNIIFDIVNEKNGFKDVDDEIFEYINLYVSDIFEKNLIASLENYQIANISRNLMLDGRPSVFIILSDKNYKFVRTTYSLSIFIDEKRVALEF